MPPGPELRYLYVHQTAKSTSQSCSESGTLPTACARSQPQMQPCIECETETESARGELAHR